VKPALLIIDMLNDFVYGKLKVPGALDIVGNIRSLIGAFKAKQLPTIYVCDSHVKGVDRELEIWGEHAIRGEWGSEVIDQLKPTPGDIVIVKRRYSGFYATDLDLTLKELNVDTVVLTGVATNVCVQHTAADAFFRNYDIIVVRDATSALSKEAHEYALDYMMRIYKARILTTKEVLELIGVQKNE